MILTAWNLSKVMAASGRFSVTPFSPTIRATALTGMAGTMVMIIASNSKVKPLPGRAHGTPIFLTPHCAQRTRGTRAFSQAWCWKKLRWRQFVRSVSSARCRGAGS